MPEEYYEEDALAPRRRPKSGAVTAVAVVNFVLGGLSSLCGLLFMVAGSFVVQMLGGLGQEIARQPPPDMPAAEVRALEAAAQVAGGIGTMIVVIVAVIILFIGVTMILAGVGVVQRKSWGRILTLILGGIASIFAILALLQIRSAWLALLIYSAYAVLVFAVLLNKENAREFN